MFTADQTEEISADSAMLFSVEDDPTLGFTVGPTFDMPIASTFRQTYSLVGDPLEAHFPNDPAAIAALEAKGYKLEVKSAKLRMKHKNTWFWEFCFSKNQKELVDYFICFGYDKEFNKLEHVWLIKNGNITGNKTIYISLNKLNEWSKYEQEFK